MQEAVSKVIGEEDVWIRPLSDKEEYFEVGHQLNCSQTHYFLSLTSCKPLHQDLLTDALTHLYRKVPVLRVCIGQKEGQLWFKKMRRCTLDLKVLDNGVFEEEHAKLIDHKFNTAEGPLFCVRVVPATGQGSGHQYVILLGTHHSVADGFTNVRICHLLHTILDDLVAGRIVDDEVQLGQFVDGQMAEQLYQQEREKLQKDPDLLRRRREQLLNATVTRPHLFDVFPLPEQDNARSLSARIELDEKTTQTFQAKCKSEGVTLHSGITGVINASLVSLMEETGRGQDQYNFSCSHDLSLRRYYDGDTSRVLGVHLPLFSFKYPFIVSKDISATFWSVVKRFHEEFHGELRGRAPLQSVALRLIENSKSDIFKFYFRSSGDLPEYYYAISNMGDVTRLVPEHGDCVQVQDIDRFSALRANATIMCFFILTYRSRFKISLAYSSRFLSQENAQKLLALIKSTVSDVCDL